MATVNATVRRATNKIVSKGDGGNLRVPGVRTIELAPSATGTVIDFKLRVPTAARPDLTSKIMNDDLATSGAPLLRLGLYPVDGNMASAVDNALTDSIALTTASTFTAPIAVIKDFANGGKTFWELAGLSVDPGGFFDVKGLLTGAPTITNTGTITLDMKYYEDQSD